MAGAFATRPLTAADQSASGTGSISRCGIRRRRNRAPREVLRNPAVSIYAEGWGREGDVGVVGEVDGAPIGACWMRCIRGGAASDTWTTRLRRLGIALQPGYRGRGFGRRMMLAALGAARAHGYRQVSLTVHPQNPAITLYESCGFVKREIRNTYHLMTVALR
jgi:ribosomal protein S18 acetylase RimI-like enzyme